MSIWTGAGAAAISAIPSLIGMGGSKTDEKRPYKLARKTELNRYLWTRKGAQAAGIHPLYALGASPVSAPSAIVGQQSEPNVGAEFAQTFRQAQQMEHEALMEKTRADAEQARAIARKNNVEASVVEKQAAESAVARMVQTPKNDVVLHSPFGGGQIKIDPNRTTPAEKFGDWFGDPFEWIYGAANYFDVQDFLNSKPAMQRAFARIYGDPRKRMAGYDNEKPLGPPMMIKIPRYGLDPFAVWRD